MIWRLVVIATYNWDDFEECLYELYFRDKENAYIWVEENRDNFQSFHCVLVPYDGDKDIIECEEDME